MSFIVNPFAGSSSLSNCDEDDFEPEEEDFSCGTFCAVDLDAGDIKFCPWDEE